jgi:hypothetical protein
MRPAQRPVYDPQAFYPDDDEPEFGAQIELTRRGIRDGDVDDA